MRRVSPLITKYYVSLSVLIGLFGCNSQDVRRSYYETGELKSVSEMKNRQLNGKHEFYYRSGKIKSRGTYTNGLADGVVEDFYENGSIESRRSWKLGKEDGQGYRYFENGKLLSSALYV